MKRGKNTLFPICIFIFYCREGAKVGKWKVTVDKNNVKDFYHVRDCPRSLMFSYRSWLKMYEDEEKGERNKG